MMIANVCSMMRNAQDNEERKCEIEQGQQIARLKTQKDGLMMINKKKYLMLFGTRPELIKLIPVWREMKKLDMDVKVQSLGQHGQLLTDMPEWAEISGAPANKWNETTNRDFSFWWAGNSFNGLHRGSEIAIDEVQPDYMIVQGDTFSTLAAAQAAYFADVPIIHVEAGVRSGDLNSPWPEEGIRRQITAIATVHFCPSIRAYYNILNNADSGTTSVNAKNIYIVGQTGLVDVPEWYLNNRSFVYGPKPILCTLHRRELNHLEALNVLEAINRVCSGGIYHAHVIRHPNNKIRTPYCSRGISIIDPINRSEMLDRIFYSTLVITDSGGVQEECEYLGKRCLVARHSTDRGFSPKVRSFDVDDIEADIQATLNTPPGKDTFLHKDSAKRIAAILYDRDNPPSEEDCSRA